MAIANKKMSRDYFAVFNILGNQVTVLYLSENDYVPQFVKPPNNACTGRREEHPPPVTQAVRRLMNQSAQRAQSIVGYSPLRAKHDFYPTPEYVTRDLLARENFTGRIWEPACGDGAIAKVFVEHGFDVIATDLIYRGYGEGDKDFFLENRIVENIVTNPPYSLGEKFVRHALKMTTGKVAMFVKLVFLEGQSRRQLFESSPLARVWVYSKRVTQHRNGEDKQYTGMMCFAWFVWEHGYSGEPVIKWI